MVNPVTGWPELVQLYGPPTAYKCQQSLDSVWLSRYPRPEEIGMDNGSEFVVEFTDLFKKQRTQKEIKQQLEPTNKYNARTNTPSVRR